MELIKKYIYAIERRLPRGGEDIAKEIESIIMDELEGKYGAKKEYSREEIETVLKAMGPPRLVAQRYRGGSDCVIGPALSYIYRMVLGIVSAATVFGLTISYIVGRFTATEDFLQGLASFGMFLGSMFSAVLSAVGAVTIIFMLIERFGDKDKLDKEIGMDWDPKDLPDLPEEKERVTIIGPIIAILMILIWAVFLNTYARIGTGIFPVYGADITILPVFNMDVVRQVLPVWNLSIVVSIVTQLILLKQGKWTLISRLMEILSKFVNIMAIVVLLNAAPLFDISAFNQLDPDFTILTANFNYWYYTGLKIILVLTAIGVVVEMIKAVVKAVRKANLG